MGILLMVVGYGWALLGFVHLVKYVGFAELAPGNEVGLTVIIFIDIILYILPGLAVGGLGGLLRKKASH